MFKKYLPIIAAVLLVSLFLVALINGFWIQKEEDPSPSPEPSPSGTASETEPARDYEPEFGDSTPKPVEGTASDGTIEIPKEEVPKAIVDERLGGDNIPEGGYNLPTILKDGLCQGTESDGYDCEYGNKFTPENGVKTFNPIGTLYTMCSGDTSAENCNEFQVDFLDYYGGRVQANYTMGSSTITLEYNKEQVSFLSMLTTESAWNALPEKEGFYTEPADEGEGGLICVYQNS